MRILPGVLLLFVISFGSATAAMAAEDEYAFIKEKLAACFACHGKNGASQNEEFPVLAGQHEYYLYLQLKDFKSESRENKQMNRIVAKLNKVELRAMAKYFSEQEWPGVPSKAGPEQISRGEQIAVAGQCFQCHQGNYMGASGTPRLAGQHTEYLKKTLLFFKYRVRNNSPDKGTLLKSFSVEDLSAMADYLGGLRGGPVSN